MLLSDSFTCNSFRVNLYNTAPCIETMLNAPVYIISITELKHITNINKSMIPAYDASYIVLKASFFTLTRLGARNIFLLIANDGIFIMAVNDNQKANGLSSNRLS